MKTCPSCKAQIASNARTCPKCGRQFTHPLLWVLVAVLALIAVGYVAGTVMVK